MSSRIALRRASALFIGSTLAGASLTAQAATPPVLAGRLSGSVYGQGSDPRGEFGKNTGTGWGGGATALLRVDKRSIINLRGDFSFLTDGNSTRRIDLAGTGGLIRLDLKTSNNIASVVVGPQLLGPSGPFMPYASALAGFSVF